MSENAPSLLAGRNSAPLTQEQIHRASQTFLSLERRINARHEAGRRTVFRVAIDDEGHQYGEVVFGSDIYPGQDILNPNSSMSLLAAAAHELTHYHRWHDLTALSDDDLEHIDEALTSLEAISRYRTSLSENDILLLVGDAIERLKLFVRQQATEASPAEVSSGGTPPDATLAEAT
ncbi:hypothetical protein [Luteolibacter sp. Populi]|uniref:hypothetical protein n=1 Tax=Luteolibacter sp. Populi TaxID=3230487 RepID=UPI003465426D